MLTILKNTATYYTNSSKFGPRRGIVAVARLSDGRLAKVAQWAKRSPWTAEGYLTAMADAEIVDSETERVEQAMCDGLNLLRGRTLDDSGEIAVSIGGWIARVTGLDPKYGFAREFQRFDLRERRWNGCLTKYMADGLYEAHSAESARKMQRTYFRIENGAVELLDQRDFAVAVREM